MKIEEIKNIAKDDLQERIIVNACVEAFTKAGINA